jgi:molybdopterin synthase sulfur carrier subunit
MMIKVHLPVDLAEAFGAPVETAVPGRTLTDVLEALEGRYPGLSRWVMDSDGRFRTHLSVFVHGRRVDEAAAPLPGLDEGDEVWILRAVSGG